MSVTISIRIDEETKQKIEDLGYRPGTFIKGILLRELKKERGRQSLNWLRKNRLKSRESLVEDLIRKDRDTK